MTKNVDTTASKEAAHTTVAGIPTSPIRYTAHVARPYAGMALLSFLVVTMAQLMATGLPFLLKQIVDTALATTDSTADFSTLFWWVMAVPAALGLMYIGWRVSGYLGMIWITKVEADSYRLLFDYVSKHSHGYFSDRFAGALSNKAFHASQGAYHMIDQTLWGHYPNLLGFLGAGALIFWTDVTVGLVFVALVAILIPANVYLARWRRPHVVAYSEKKSEFRGRTVDLMTNIAAMRQYSRRPHEMKELTSSISSMRQADIKQWRISEHILVLNNIFITAAIGFIMYLMFGLWQDGTVSAGDFVLVATLIFNMAHTLTFIGHAINQVIRVYGEMEEGLNEIMIPHEVKDSDTAGQMKKPEGSINFDSTQFSFGENKVFNGFNLTIPAGQRVGLVGPSGAGKTTFVSLLLRQHDLDSGSISIDGQDISKVTQDSLREHIAVVPQEPLLFHRTIRENIAYGNPDATDDEIVEVAKKAQAHDFISDLPEGYDTLVGERGVKLSGGQKQRVAIARAMLKDAPILVLDEATSALDSESEVAIQKALHELMVGKTVVAIAHRLSTLREMDRIIVMEDGKVVEDGAHEELATAGGTYQRLWEHQAGGFLQE